MLTSESFARAVFKFYFENKFPSQVEIGLKFFFIERQLVVELNQQRHIPKLLKINVMQIISMNVRRFGSRYLENHRFYLIPKLTTYFIAGSITCNFKFFF